MTPAQIIAAIEGLGGHIETRGGQMRVKAPKGRMKPEIIEALKEKKPEVEAVLTEQIDFPGMDDFERAVLRHGVGVAIDRATGNALLMVSESVATACSRVADVHRPPFLEILLTEEQRQAIESDIEFMDGLKS